MTAAHVAVNGRFVGVPVTGVQRYSHELVSRLPGVWDGEVSVIVPGGGRPLQGPPGHAWEQVVLPARVRRAGADLLFSPASWGPVAVRRQLLFVHDLGPLLHPGFYAPDYVRLATTLLPPLLRRCDGIATSCERGSEELQAAGVPASRVHVVPPGVSPTFSSVELRPAGDHCTFVGGHDARKNLAFLVDLWPRVHAELGLTLRVVERTGTSTRVQGADADVAGVERVVDPGDAELADLLAGSLCLLWPSLYEGFGLPLVEAMATGTPFLSTDTGVARELAVDPTVQVQPLEADRWVEVLRGWRAGGGDGLRAPSAERARAMTWDRSAQALRAALLATSR